MFLLGAIFYIASIAAGITLANYFLHRLTDEILVRYAFAFPIGFVISSYLVLGMDAIAGSFSGWLMIIASVLLFLLSYLLYKKARNREMFDLKLLGKQYRANRQYYILVFTVVFMLLALQILGVSQNGRGIFGGDNYGTDFLFHLSIGNSVVYTTFPPKLLYTANTTNVFPFITDFFSAMLTYTGIGPVSSLYMTNFPLYFSLVMLSVYFIYSITKRRYAAVVGFVLFLLCSLWFNAVLIYLTGVNFQFFSNSTVQQAAKSGWMNLFQQPIYNFSDPLVSNFAPQHDLVLGFPYALIVLLFLYLAFFKKDERAGKGGAGKDFGTKEFAFVGLLVGLMPLVHPFSMIFVFMFAAVAFFYSIYRYRRGFGSVFLKRWLPLGAVSVVVALPLLLYIHGGSLASTFFMSELTDSIWYTPFASVPKLVLWHVEFWFVTMGAILVLGLIGLYFLRKDLIIFAPAFLGLLMINIVRVQPSFGDSNKIALYFLFFMAISASELLARMAKRRIWFKAMAVALFFIVTLSGFMPEYGLLFNGGGIIAPSTEINATSWIVNNTPQDAVFINNCYNNVFGGISGLAGRHAVLENLWYITLVGIFKQNPYNVSNHEDAFLANPTCQFVQESNASYVVLMNLSNFAPDWCTQPNLTAFSSSPNFTEVRNFSEPYNRIEIFRSNCG